MLLRLCLDFAARNRKTPKVAETPEVLWFSEKIGDEIPETKLPVSRDSVTTAAAQKFIDDYNDEYYDGLFKQAKDLSQFSDEWVDKRAGLWYSRETMERNFRDIAKGKHMAEIEALIDTYFTPVHEHEAERLKFTDKMYDPFRKMKLTKAEPLSSIPRTSSRCLTLEVLFRGFHPRFPAKLLSHFRAKTTKLLRLQKPQAFCGFRRKLRTKFSKQKAQCHAIA